MDTANLVTGGVALASLFIALMSWLETQRQGRAAVRPVLVVLEKLTDNKNPEGGLSLYLVNVGEAAALNCVIVGPDLSKASLEALQGNWTKHLQTDVAKGRRIRLAGGYERSVAGQLELEVEYRDRQHQPSPGTSRRLPRRSSTRPCGPSSSTARAMTSIPVDVSRAFAAGVDNVELIEVDVGHRLANSRPLIVEAVHRLASGG